MGFMVFCFKCGPRAHGFASFKTVEDLLFTFLLCHQLEPLLIFLITDQVLIKTVVKHLKVTFTGFIAVRYFTYGKQPQQTKLLTVHESDESIPLAVSNKIHTLCLRKKQARTSNIWQSMKVPSILYTCELQFYPGSSIKSLPASL